MTPLEKELLDFVAGVANVAHGSIRAGANRLLAKAGLPTVPLAANDVESIQAASDIRRALDAK